MSLAGASSPSAKTIITREKGDARFAPIAHLSDTGDPHDVQAVQVEYSGTLGASVQAALDTLEAFPPGGVTSVFGRGGVIVALAGDYAAFYLELTGGTMTGVLELVGGAIGDEAASANDALSIANALVVTHAGLINPHSDSLATSDKASQPEAEAGADNDAWMTPLRVQQLIDTLGLVAPTGLLAMTPFTSSGTWTPHADAQSALIFCTGGGADGTNASPGNGAKGGGAGATAIDFIDDTTGITSETVTVGGPTATSRVVSFASAGGGNVDRTGGTATVGDLLIRGGQGGASAGSGATGGAGGASWWGGENAFGAGGQGDTDGADRGSGKAGVVLILEW